MPARLLDSVKADGLQPAVAQHQTSAGLDAVLAEGHATRFQGQVLVPAVPEVVLAEDAVLAEVRLAVLAGRSVAVVRWTSFSHKSFRYILLMTPLSRRARSSSSVVPPPRRWLRS